MVASTLVGVAVIAQPSASASGYGADAFMNLDGSIRYVANTSPSPTNQYGWANSGALTPVSTCLPPGIGVSGSNGLFDCGSPSSLNTVTRTFVPNPPTYIGPASFTSPQNVLAHSFQTAPSNNDYVNCASGATQGSFQFGANGHGNNKFDDGISQLTYQVGSVPGKDQLTDAYVVSRSSSNHHIEVYFGEQRPENLGDAHIDFQFLQNPVSANGDCGTTFSGQREQGDFLVEVNYTVGGTLGTPAFYVWTCTTASPTGTACDTAGSWVPTTVTTGPTGILQVVTNTAPTACGGWVCEGLTAGGLVDTNEFAEGAIDLTALANAQTQGFSLGCASNMFVETRTSQSDTATIEAFAKPVTFASCEPTTTVTTPSATSGALGTSFTDGVTVTGNSAHGAPTGDVTFYVCSNTTTGCNSTTGTKITPGTNPVTLTGSTTSSSTATSPSFTPTAPGNYCFAGYYTPTPGNFYKASSDTSAGECFTVTALTPGFTTSPTNPSITFGGTNTDTASVIGNSTGGVPGGTVQFYLCKESTVGTPCTGGTADGTPVTLTPPVSGFTATALSPTATPSSAGTWCFNASYTATPGGNYASVSTETNPTAECFTVNKQGTQAPTQVSTSNIVFGAGGITDTVSVSPSSGTGPAPTGSVQFYVCQTSSTFCSLSSSGTHTVGTAVSLTPPLTGSTSTATSDSFVPTAPGTWCFAAVYSGDGNYLASQDNTNADNADSNECVVVTAAPTATTTTVIDNGTSVAWDNTETTGAMAYDTATVAPNPTFANAPTPTGTISYTFFPNGSCTKGTGSPAGSNLALGTPSTTEGPLAAGSYSFQATYSGDTNYLTSTGACEPFTVAKGTSTTATTVFDAGTNSAWTGSEIGTPSAYDTSTVTPSSDSFLPTGTVSYVFFSNGTCSGTGTAAGTKTLDNSGLVPNSDTEGPLAQGSYSFQATYSGDTNFAGSTGACEPFTLAYPVINVVKSEPTPGDGMNVVAGVDTITYNLAVTNTGLAAATDLTVTDAIPAGATYVPGSANLGGVYDSTTNTISWALASVPAAVDGTAGTAGPLSFQVTVNAADTDGSVITNQAAFSDINTVECNAGPVEGTCLTNQVSNPVVKPIINVVKSEPTPGDGQTVTAGQSAPITYSLTVTNAGSSAATNVTVTDVIPAGTTYVSGSANAGGTYDSTTNTITWIVASVPGSVNGTAGTAGPLTFQVTVNSTDANGSTITNQAAFSDINTGHCTPGTVKGTCLTNQVNNPVVAITPTPATAPLVTTTTLKQVLAFTGADVRALIIIAAFMLGSGLLVLVLGRRRRRQNG